MTTVDWLLEVSGATIQFRALPPKLAARKCFFQKKRAKKNAAATSVLFRNKKHSRGSNRPQGEQRTGKNDLRTCRVNHRAFNLDLRFRDNHSRGLYPLGFAHWHGAEWAHGQKKWGVDMKTKTERELFDILGVAWGASVRDFMATDEKTMRQIFGAEKTEQIQAVFELDRRAKLETIKEKDVFRSPSDVRAYLAARIEHESVEVFCVMYLDRRNRLIACEEAMRGTIDKAHVYPREIVKRALELNASCLVLAHNHPCGSMRPSTADIEMTRTLKNACGALEIDIHDHIIIAKGEGVCSMREAGLM